MDVEYIVEGKILSATNLIYVLCSMYTINAKFWVLSIVELWEN